jgi:hypothetical protein
MFEETDEFDDDANAGNRPPNPIASRLFTLTSDCKTGALKRLFDFAEQCKSSIPNGNVVAAASRGNAESDRNQNQSQNYRYNIDRHHLPPSCAYTTITISRLVKQSI